MEGTMVPIGQAKGAALALVVELLTAGLTGSNFAFQASSFFSADGAPPRVAQSFVVLDPGAFNDAPFVDGVEQLVAHITAQPAVRLPGDRRLSNRARARAEGVAIPRELLAELRQRAG